MSHQRFTFVLYLCYSAALFCVSAKFQHSNENDVYLLPAYAIAWRASLLDSATCKSELRDFRDAVDRRILWALKTLDSSGSVKLGFLYGNKFWLGSRMQCLDIMNRYPFELAERKILNNTQYHDLQTEFPPFEVNYFVAHLRHNGTLQYQIGIPNDDLITLGLCLPASCSTNDISIILEKVFRDKVLLISNLYSADVRLIQVKNLKDDHQWLLSGAIPVICIVLVLHFFMMIIGTIYDMFIYQRYLKNKTMNKTAVDVKNATVEMEMTDSPFPCEKSRIGNVLMCFSIYTNTKRIFNTELTAESIPIIHSLKFLTMMWIIMSHVILFTNNYSDNTILFLRLSESIPAQILSNATFSVDTYFFLSGFLLVYMYLNKNANKGRNKSINYGVKLRQFFDYVLIRFIRLTPAYMMMIGIVQLNSTWYEKTSVFYITEKSHETCAKYWWRNLLYINNLFGIDSMCLIWSWYLANDMQFYLIGIALLILSSVFFYTAVAILGTLLIGSIIASGYISYINEYVPTLDEQYSKIDVIYFPPWMRIGPYIIGMITSYIIIKLNKKIILKRSIVILCWCLGSACNIFVLFGLYNRQISVLFSAIYVALSRTVWAIGIAWILIVCFTDHGGIVKELLTSKIWIPLSRLTYCAYLLNPFIIHSTNLYSETSVHLETVSLSVKIMGFTMISYICAYALSLMVETPYILLMKTFRQSHTRKYKRHEITILRDYDENTRVMP